MSTQGTVSSELSSEDDIFLQLEQVYPTASLRRVNLSPLTQTPRDMTSSFNYPARSVDLNGVTLHNFSI